MGRPMRSARVGELLDLHAASREASLTYCKALQESPRAGDVGQPPLHHLAAAQSGPDALVCTLCRRVGHVPVVRQLERRILRTRGEAGALLRHVALDVGEDGLEFGFVADRCERGVVIAIVAPPCAPSTPLRLTQLREGFRGTAAQGGDPHVGDAKAAVDLLEKTDSYYDVVTQRPTEFAGTTEEQLRSRALARLLQDQRQVDGRKEARNVELRHAWRNQLWIGDGVACTGTNRPARAKVDITQQAQCDDVGGPDRQRSFGRLCRLFQRTAKYVNQGRCPGHADGFRAKTAREIAPAPGIRVQAQLCEGQCQLDWDSWGSPGRAFEPAPTTGLQRPSD